MSKVEKFTAPKKADQKWLLVDEELEEISSYAAKKITEVRELYDSFRDMSYFRLLRDSKVPENDKKFYNRFSLSASHRENVLREIQNYQEFYKELIDIVLKVSNEEEHFGYEKEKPYIIFHDLNEKLSIMTKVAKHGKDTTASSAVFNLHQLFIEKHEMLENMILRIQCVFLKKDLKKATDVLEASVKSVKYLETSLKATEEAHDEMCTRFERLLKQNDLLLDQQKLLLENNKKLEQQIKRILLENTAENDGEVW